MVWHFYCNRDDDRNFISQAEDLLDSNTLYPEGDMTLPKLFGTCYYPLGAKSISELRRAIGNSAPPDEISAFKYALASDSFTVRCVTEQLPEIPFLTFGGRLFSFTSPTTQSTLKDCDGK